MSRSFSGVFDRWLVGPKRSQNHFWSARRLQPATPRSGNLWGLPGLPQRPPVGDLNLGSPSAMLRAERRMYNMNLIAVFLENKPGQTARVTKILAEARVNIRWLIITNQGSFGVMKFLVDKSEEAVQSLRRNGLMVSLLDVLAVEVPNAPGGLERVASSLGRSNLNLDSCSGFVANDRTILIIEVQEKDQARAVLEKEGFRLLSQSELLRL